MKFEDVFKKNLAVWIVVGLFVFAKLLFLTRFHAVIWDEAIYIGLGKYLWSAGHAGLFDMQRPLGLSMLIGLFWKLGLDPVFFGELLAMAFSGAAIFVIYLIGKKMFNPTTGLMAALMLGTLPQFVLQSSAILTDIPSVFFALLAFYFLIERRWALVGVFSGLAFLFRFPHGLMLVSIVLSLAITYFIKKDKKILKNIIAIGIFFLITISPWLVFNALHFSKEPISVLEAAVRPLHSATANVQSVMLHFERDPGFYVKAALKQNILFVFAIPFIFLYFRRKLYRELPVNAALMATALYIIYFSFFVFNEERYTISFLPFLTLISAAGLSLFASFKNRKLNGVVKIALMVLFVSVIARDLNIDKEYYNWRYVQEPQIYSEYYRYFQNNPIEGAIFTTDPLLAAYADNKFFAVSFDLPGTAFEYETRKDSFAAFVYSDGSFPCLANDKKCETAKKDFLDRLNSENSLVFNRTYYGNANYIFLRKPSAVLS